MAPGASGMLVYETVKNTWSAKMSSINVLKYTVAQHEVGEKNLGVGEVSKTIVCSSFGVGNIFRDEGWEVHQIHSPPCQLQLQLPCWKDRKTTCQKLEKEAIAII